MMSDDIVIRLRSFGDTVGSMGIVSQLHNQAAEEIVRLRAVLDAIDALHQPCNDGSGIMVCKACDLRAPCRTHLLIHPMTLDEAIWILGDVHK
jgi:hypothetical protein